MGSVLAALLIDIHTAIVFTVITSLLGGLWLNDPLYSIYIFSTGLTGAFGVIRCKKRSGDLERWFLYQSAKLIYRAGHIHFLRDSYLLLTSLQLPGSALPTV